MRLEIARLVADYLSANLGTQIAAVERPGDVPLPATPRVVDETRDGVTARGDTPDRDLPVVQVAVEGLQAEAVRSASTRFFEARVLVRLTWSKSAATEQQVAACSVVMRAVHRCLTRLAQQGAAVRNIAVGTVDGVFEDAGVWAPNEDGTLTVGALFTLNRCRDTAA